MNIKNYLDDDLWESIESNFKSGKFTNAIVDAMLFLSNVLREKSSLDEDGVKLVNNCFSKNDPKIKITKLETETERSIQEGAASILRGLFLLVRNPRHHEKIEDRETDAVQIILFISYMLNIIEKSKSKFDIDSFESILFDEEFVDEDDYVKLIVKRIPKRKIFEVLIHIYRQKHRGNIYHIEKFFSLIFDKLSEIEKTNFLQIISEDLLRTSSDNERKYILRCFPPNMWGKVDEIARLRTENRIIKSVESGRSYDNKDTSDGWFGTWCTNLFTEFSLDDKLLDVILGKLSSNDVAQIKYCFKYLLNPMWNMYSKADLEILEKSDISLMEIGSKFLIIDAIREEIEKGNKLFNDYVKYNKFRMPNEIKPYYTNVLKNFKENKEIETTSPDDYPESDDEDDVPF